jgi:putative peptidoglycan lipid II flippase
MKARSMGVLRSATVVSASTLVSRILGMIRDIACASLLGAGAAWDAFVVAWRIPNLFRRLLGEGALSSAFIPIFTAEREARGDAAAFGFFRAVLTLLTIVLAVLTVIGVATALLLPTDLFGDDTAKAELTLSVLAIVFPYVLLVNVMALFMAILNSLDRFFAPAIAPAVLNIFWIGGALLAPAVSSDPATQVRVVATAILLGGVVQLAIQIPVLLRSGVSLRPSTDFRKPAVRRMLLLMWPMVLGLAPVQVSILVDTLIAEAMIEGDGANSYLFYGNRLVQFPIALIGIAMAIVVFPVFSRQARAGASAALDSTLRQSLRFTFFLSLPATAGLAVLATPLIRLIFERGAFGPADTEATAGVLAMYAVGIPAYCGLQILTRLYYSMEEVRTPVRMGAVMVAVNLVLNLLLVGPLKEAGLSLATALAATLNFAILALLARRRLGVGSLAPVVRSALASAALAGVMALAVWGAFTGIATLFPDPNLWQLLVVVLVPIGVGAAVHIGGGLLLRFPEARRLIPGRRRDG